MVIKSAEVAHANIISLKDIIEQHKRYKEALINIQTHVGRGGLQVDVDYIFKQTQVLTQTK